MRVYTNQTITVLWSYVKLAAALGVLGAVVFYGFNHFQNDPTLQQLKNLTGISQPR